MRKQIEKQLIDRALKGESEAFGEIYIQLRGTIYGFVFRMLREVSFAEQITQETFMFLLENPKKFDPERGDILPFLCGVARRKVVGHLRKHGTQLEISDDNPSNFESNGNSNHDPLNELLNKELGEVIEKKLSNLVPLQREVLILREFEELSYTEIAEITQADLNQVKVRIHRARKKLAHEMKPYLAASEEQHYEMHGN